MGKRIKRANFWVRRKSFIPLFLIGGVVVLLLFFNEETSVALNMEYEEEINRLNQEITECLDSAKFYHAQREALLNENSDLEKIAREKFLMQYPNEDVYIIR